MTDASAEAHPEAVDSLRALALGDGFGERWFFRRDDTGLAMIRTRTIPDDLPWHWTDDTALALALVRTLTRHGEVDQQALATEFAETHHADAHRRYGYGMHQLLPMLLADPGNWATYARTLFHGEGSFGNGAAMRVAPLGAWFHRDPERAAEQAARQAEVTHAHVEGIAGAVAVAVAAALAAAGRGTPAPEPEVFLDAVARATPEGVIRDGLRAALKLPGTTPVDKVVTVLGNGRKIRASDTVPFAVWAAAHHLDSLTDALWTTAEGFGDVDTTCAITGGIVGARTGLGAVPDPWLAQCEDLPEWVAEL